MIIYYLCGNSASICTIESFVTHFQPRVVLLSAITPLPFQQYPTLPDLLDELAGKNPSTQFFLGGTGSIDHLKHKKLNSIKVVNSLDEVLNTL